MDKKFYFTLPSDVFQFEDCPEILGAGSGATRMIVGRCENADIARFIKDACNAELKRRAYLATSSEPK